MIEFKGSHSEREVILWGIRWYVAYPIGYRQLEEMLEERGVDVDHSTLNRWVVIWLRSIAIAAPQNNAALAVGKHSIVARSRSSGCRKSYQGRRPSKNCDRSRWRTASSYTVCIRC